MLRSKNIFYDFVLVRGLVARTAQPSTGFSNVSERFGKHFHRCSSI